MGVHPTVTPKGDTMTYGIYNPESDSLITPSGIYVGVDADVFEDRDRAEEVLTRLRDEYNPDLELFEFGEFHAEIVLNTEGISMSLYNGQDLIDETWETWADLYPGEVIPPVDHEVRFTLS